MNFKDFKAGAYKQQFEYRSFTPASVNHSWVWEDPKINTLLERATKALGELNAFSFIVPDVDLFIRMHVTKEAQASSRIEGTATTMDEAVIERKEEIAPERRDDWQEVRNYIDAMNAAVEDLATLPLSNRLLLKTHGILLRGVRGQHKTPGDFRRSQNWIGGASLTDAVFVPPHHDELPALLTDLEKFWHNEEIHVPHLVRVAISHYQFETIHPFLDGNGRIGRLLITLYLVSHGLLAKPALYLSDHFERHKGAYYDALTTVRASNDMAHWLKFFLSGIVATAEKGRETFRGIVALKAEVDAKLPGMGRRAKNAQALLTLLYRQPVVSVSAVVEQLGLSPQTAGELLQYFEKESILRETTNKQRNRTYAFERYLSLF